MIDTIFKSKSIIITNTNAEIVSYVDIGALLQATGILLLSALIITIISGIHIHTRSITDNKVIRPFLTIRGYYTVLISAWLGDLYLLITISGYNKPWLLIILSVSIILYVLIQVIIALERMGFEPGMIFRVIGSVTKSVFNKDPKAVVDMVEEVGKNEERKKGRIGKDITTLLPIIIIMGIFVSCIGIKQVGTPRAEIRTVSDTVSVTPIETYIIEKIGTVLNDTTIIYPVEPEKTRDEIIIPELSDIDTTLFEVPLTSVEEIHNYRRTCYRYKMMYKDRLIYTIIFKLA